MLNLDIIKTLPYQFKGQESFLVNQGDEFISTLFDNIGYSEDSLSAKELSEVMPEKFGRGKTIVFKTRSAITYLLAEGKLTGTPQIFKVAGKYRFTP